MMKSNLKQLRTEAGLSLQELGDMSGFSKAHMHQLEYPSANPTLRTAYAIAKVLDKTIYDIWPNEVEVVIETTTTRRIKK